MITVKTRYKKYAKISEAKFKKILKLFCVDLTAVQIAEIIGLNRNTVNKYLKLIRQQIAAICESESPFSGEVEVDECYFGAKRVRKGVRLLLFCFNKLFISNFIYQYFY